MRLVCYHPEMDLWLTTLESEVGVRRLARSGRCTGSEVGVRRLASSGRCTGSEVGVRRLASSGRCTGSEVGVRRLASSGRCTGSEVGVRRLARSGRCTESEVGVRRPARSGRCTESKGNMFVRLPRLIAHWCRARPVFLIHFLLVTALCVVHLIWLQLKMSIPTNSEINLSQEEKLEFR